MSTLPDEDMEVPHSYFIPMVDMLAGVVFILVILLASVTLVSREDFTKTADATHEIAKIDAALAAARKIDETLLEPRRNADAALRVLLERMKARLAERGIAAEIAPEEGRLSIAANEGFAPSSAVLTARGEQAASVIAEALAKDVLCLSPGRTPRPGAGCEAFPPATLDRAIVAVEDDAGSDIAVSTARALGFLSAASVRAPMLVGLKAVDGGQLLGYRAFARPVRKKPGAGSTPAPDRRGTETGQSSPAPSSATPPNSSSATAAGEGATIVLDFQMDVPPIPNP